MPIIIFVFIMLFSPDLLALPFNNQFSFAPPASDLSVIFLGNVFGVVDGVLSGSGSQLFGKMIGVFNASLLALGSILVIYTIVVGTLYTAHEGEFLGKQWSSIWIPVRSVIGVALLIPKASGYSLIQIFVMWVVLQGVGAADKVWTAALEYLNVGGKLIQAQTDNATNNAGVDNKGNPIYQGAAVILSGQVCMLALQNYIQKVHETYKAGSSCDANSSGYAMWKDFCMQDVPDFLGTVDFVSVQKNSGFTADPASTVTFTADMPSISSGFYQFLNGACGSVKWNSLNLSKSQIQGVTKVSDSDWTGITLTRPIAIQQMYDNLQVVAQQMVSNDPQLNAGLLDSVQDRASDAAAMQYGVALRDYNSAPCRKREEGDAACKIWGPVRTASAIGVLFSGNELNNAINAYNNIMMPTLNLMDAMKEQDQAKKLRSFIAQSEADGWIFAGSYFFKLVRLSGSTMANQNLIDQGSGLDGSVMVAPTSDALACGTPGMLRPCSILSGTTPTFSKILANLILGQGSTICSSPLVYGATINKVSNGYISGGSGNSVDFSTPSCSSTTFGYIGNTYFLVLPGQPGTNAPKFPDLNIPFYHPSDDNTPISTPCGGVSLGFFSICLGRAFLSPLVDIGKQIFKVVIDAVYGIAFGIVQVVVVGPLEATVWPLLNQAWDVITEPSSSPIVNLANMGAVMIDQTFTAYLILLGFSLIGALPMVGVFFKLLLSMAMPIIASWLMYFMSIGFMTAYYVPLLPYIIFTFGTIAWLIAVIESMVAAPVVALGVMTPEGEGLLGRSEQGFMILLNVFLRPSMMVIGFLMAVVMTYVSVWILNAGFSTGASFLITGDEGVLSWSKFMMTEIFGRAFFVFIYISLYSTVVQKAFNLIYLLPDKVLRWVGGTPESYGTDVAQWAEESKKFTEQMGSDTGKASYKGIKEGKKTIKDEFGGGDDKGGGGSGQTSSGGGGG